jgi:XTP/dITP diphosphohydrolase/tetrapyrrole methylase family protein/MazG family protein
MPEPASSTSNDASDRPPAGASAPTTVDAGEKIYEDQFAESAERLEAYADFSAIVKQLRRDCPWDRRQTHESVKHLLIEEAYEVVEAIEAGDDDELRKELGDVFLHVLFHSRIAEEDGRFSIKDVIDAEVDKLVRRHPHVFGDESAADAEEVMDSWEQIKQQERDGEEDAPASALDGVPAQLPALLRAFRMQQKAAGVGFEFLDRHEAWAKVEEEMREFRRTLEAEAFGDGDPSESEREEEDETDGPSPAQVRQEEELGDVLFALANYARFAGLNPENALRRTNDAFTQRFQHVERQLADTDRSFEDLTVAEAIELWENAKQQEG